MTARNSPCPCGSGKKFKRCHGSAESGKPLGDPMPRAQAALRRGQHQLALQLAGEASNSPEKYRLMRQLLVSRRQPGDLEKARGYLKKWVIQQPGNPEPLQGLMEIYLFRNQLDKAGKALDKISDLAPHHPHTHYFKAVLLQLKGQFNDAMQAYSEAIRLRENKSDEAPHLDSAALEVAAAMQLCETAAGNYPGASARQQHGMFDCRFELELLEDRLLNWQQEMDRQNGAVSQELKNVHSDAWYNLGCAALGAYTENDRRITLFQRAIDLNDEHVLARLNLAFSLNYSISATPDEIFRVHEETGHWLENRFGQPDLKFDNTPEHDRPLRIGYLSSDFRNHSVAHFILPVLQQHKPEEFEVFIYHNHVKEDAYTQDARSNVSQFRNVSGLGDQAVHRAIRSDQIDILIDLNGLTEHNRMVLLAMRAAPIQISWIGYPNTTGLRTVDYRIVDETTDPHARPRQFNTEKLIHMPDTFSIYQPPDDLPDLSGPPCMENGFVTFGSFNNMAKLNGPLIRTWSEVLHKVKDSRIYIKNIALGHAEPANQLRLAFGEHGIDPGRIEVSGQFPSKKEHLESISNVDICLDSFPYSGTTTTCDSLIMGVPVISRSGLDHRSRVSYSQLKALGLGSLTGKDENAYINSAVELAYDPDRLIRLRTDLRHTMQSSALMDAESFTRNLESRLTEVWAAWCNEEEHQ